jgi:hypothetical protein
LPVGISSEEAVRKTQTGFAGVADYLSEGVEEGDALPFGFVNSLGRPTRSRPDSRLQSSALNRSHAALAPKFWLGRAPSASSFTSTSLVCSIVQALPRRQSIMSRPPPALVSEWLVTMQRCDTRSL